MLGINFIYKPSNRKTLKQGWENAEFKLWIFDMKESLLIFKVWWWYSVQFSHSVVSNSLRPQGLQHTRPPCPSPTPGDYSDSCPLSQWCHPTISSSVAPFSSCLQSFPASGPFPVSQFFTSGGQNTQNDRNYPKNRPTSFVYFISMAFLIGSYFAWILPVTGNIHYFEEGSPFFFFLAAPDGLWDLHFHTSHGIWAPANGSWNPNHWATREFPKSSLFHSSKFVSPCLD